MESWLLPLCDAGCESEDDVIGRADGLGGGGERMRFGLVFAGRIGFVVLDAVCDICLDAGEGVGERVVPVLQSGVSAISGTSRSSPGFPGVSAAGGNLSGSSSS